MKAIEDYYHKWIKTDKATKYRNSPKYRYSEMIAFTDAYSKYRLRVQQKEYLKRINYLEQQNKELKDLQRLSDEIKKWSDKIFGSNPARIVGMSKHLEKEAIELSKELMFFHDEFTLSDDVGVILRHKKLVTEELADCMMLIIDIASHLPISILELIKAVNDKLEVNKKRKWGTPDKFGTVEHLNKD